MIDQKRHDESKSYFNVPDKLIRFNLCELILIIEIKRISRMKKYNFSFISIKN